LTLFNRTCVFLLAVLSAVPVLAQEGEFGRWEPFGPAPVDQAGAGRRGYSIAGESADVAEPHANSVSFHMVGANNFYVERTAAIDISQRSETHTLALDFRRGFKVGSLPRFEIGTQIEINESDAGMLNGFISGFEDLVHASLRSKMTTLPPPGTYVMKNGQQIYHTTDSGRGFGDVTVVAKAALRDADPTSRDTRVTAHVAVNVAGASEFTEGNFAGAGLSIEKKLSEWAAFHGDLRATMVMDRVSTWGLPLTRGVLGFSVGPELRLARNTSLNLQYDGATSPYLPTGTAALDAGYGDISFGLNHRFTAGRRFLVTQLYARENMVLPFSVRWNADPDFAIGIKTTIR
jgi:hypothetical protein